MPDNRSHRGPHPDDVKLFGAAALSLLREAASDYIWLRNRAYAQTSALKLVGDRYRLTKRQRQAIARSTCCDEALRHRSDQQLGADQLRGRTLLIDGFNVLVTVEAALAGGLVLHARDGCYRDMSSMHGTYRRTDETLEALKLLGEVTEPLQTTSCCWYFDRPVSNSGRVAEATRQVGVDHGWAWDALAVDDPDSLLAGSRDVIATADSAVLDRCGPWLNLARLVIDQQVPDAWVVDFSPSSE